MVVGLDDRPQARSLLKAPLAPCFAARRRLRSQAGVGARASPRRREGSMPRRVSGFARSRHHGPLSITVGQNAVGRPLESGYRLLIFAGGVRSSPAIATFDSISPNIPPGELNSAPPPTQEHQPVRIARLRTFGADATHEPPLRHARGNATVSTLGRDYTNAGSHHSAARPTNDLLL